MELTDVDQQACAYDIARLVTAGSPRTMPTVVAVIRSADAHIAASCSMRRVSDGALHEKWCV